MILLVLVHLAKRREHTSRQIGGYCRFIFTPRAFNWCALAENSICVAKYSRISEPMAKVCSTGMVVVPSTCSVCGEFLLKFVLITSKKVGILCWYWNHIMKRNVCTCSKWDSPISLHVVRDKEPWSNWWSSGSLWWSASCWCWIRMLYCPSVSASCPELPVAAPHGHRGRISPSSTCGTLTLSHRHQTTETKLYLVGLNNKIKYEKYIYLINRSYNFRFLFFPLQ